MKNFNKKDVFKTLKMMLSDKVDVIVIMLITGLFLWGLFSKNYDMMGAVGFCWVYAVGAVYRMAWWKNKVAENMKN